MKKRRDRRFKRKRKNLPNDETEHHRRPKSLGGTDDPENISTMPRYQHEAWHVLFGNLKTEKLFKRFKRLFAIFAVAYQDEEIRNIVHSCWTCKKKSRLKKKAAWSTLFSGISNFGIVELMNNVWLDPAYKIILQVHPRPHLVLVSLE